ncbi:peptidase M23 [Philodulcilactobacillus myokoensis]|uniref:Peptidase M23 n=1 Tax=Philodulcilactobacillus myokoensis TaxID=2929573 RepID=A0A9W6B3Y5_9LACO|nr:LysM domain-containing protein [Philodulcilactobacillus myokoensis]GLB47309.1 peptidase M23 [Philodulcilactobacillus myokoensis]
MSLNKRIKKMLITTTAAAGLLIAGAGVASASSVTVHSGDTLSSISRNNNVSLSSLEQANSLSDSSVIYVGQQLTLPGTGTQTTVSTPAQNTQSTQTTQPSTTQSSSNDTSNSASAGNSSDAAAKAWIVSHESGGSYSASNGSYVGKYQLDASYLNGDYSQANQDRVANQYVSSRYGSWTNAQSFWQSHGWY